MLLVGLVGDVVGLLVGLGLCFSQGLSPKHHLSKKTQKGIIVAFI